MTWPKTESREWIFTAVQLYSRYVIICFFYMAWPKTESRERIRIFTTDFFYITTYNKTTCHITENMNHMCEMAQCYSQFFYMTWPKNWIARTSFHSCPLRFMNHRHENTQCYSQFFLHDMTEKLNRESEFSWGHFFGEVIFVRLFLFREVIFWG